MKLFPQSPILSLSLFLFALNTKLSEHNAIKQELAA